MAATASVWMRIILIWGILLSLEAIAVSNQESGIFEHSPMDAAMTTAGGIPPSPRCWMATMEAFQSLLFLQHDRPTEDICAAMLPQHHKVFALELTRCHLEDLGRVVFVETTTEGCDAVSDLMLDDDASKHCFRSLTDTAISSYTHFLTYTTQLCIRLTQELLLAQQEDTAHQLAMATEQAADKFSILQKQQSKIWKDQDDMLQSFRSDLSMAVSEQGTMFKTQVLHLLSEYQLRLEERDRMLSQQQEAWVTRLKSAQQEQLHVMEQQQQELSELASTVSSTRQTMQPLLGLEALVNSAVRGFTWLTSVLFFMGMLNVVWLLTLPSRYRWTRSFLFGVVVVEALIESALHWLSQEGSGCISNEERIEVTTILRTWAFYMELGVYAMGLITSLFRGKPKTPPSTDGRPSNSVLELERKMDKLHAELLLCIQQKSTTTAPPHMARDSASISSADLAMDPPPQQETPYVPLPAMSQLGQEEPVSKIEPEQDHPHEFAYIHSEERGMNAGVDYSSRSRQQASLVNDAYPTRETLVRRQILPEDVSFTQSPVARERVNGSSRKRRTGKDDAADSGRPAQKKRRSDSDSTLVRVFH